jgi:pimeloyl-ACP methyl ester carboxylesterase
VPSRDLDIGGRVVTVFDDGDPDGPAILCHHGTPAAGAPFAGWVQDVTARGARLISYARPGYGGSTPAPDRTVADAAADSAAIMDALGVERFVTWGISGGGPHALACAALLGDRVAAAASLAGVASFDAPGLNYFRGMGQDNIVEFGLAMGGREHIEPFVQAAAGEMLSASPAEIRDSIATLVSEPDRLALDGPVGNWWTSILPLTFAAGAEGWVEDDLAFVAPFGFDVAAIGVPTLVVHGRLDQFVPVGHGEWLAGAIPGAESWIGDGDGHLTLMVDRVPDVHAWLLERLS